MARNKPTFLYAIISVALVLFIVGFFGLTALHGHKLVQMFKEKVDIWLELKNNTPPEEIARIVQQVERQPFVKTETVKFIPRSQAMKLMQEDLGDESLLETTPDLLRDVVQFNVRADYLQDDSLNQWRETLRQDTMIEELYFEAANTGNVSRNIQNLGYVTLVLGFLLIFAAITLIHNTIRLALYANRFLIKNQELVGASWSFISRPYIQRGIMNGLWSAALAIMALFGTLWWIQRLIPEVQEIEDFDYVVFVFIGMILLGVLISGLSTWFVVNKFLKMRVDDLY